jgi:ubiquinone biosynthesis protein
MTALTVPLVIVFTTVTVLVFALGARRLLGLPFSLVRTLLAGLIAFLLAGPIVTSIGGSAVTGDAGALPGLWFVMLGVAIALLVGMVFLVLGEAFVPSGSLPGPVYVLRSLRARLHRARRYSQISRILLRHGLLPYLRGGRRAELATPEGRARLAAVLHRALDDGGVTFVKLGQVLSTRRDLLPAEFLEELSRLQDQAEPEPWPLVERLLREELGTGVEQLFGSFEMTPMAAASIAQVHAATLHSGEPVVVKVCRPGISTVVDWDLDIVQRLAVRLERSTRWGRSIGAVALARGFAAALREELDLRVEVRNMTSLASATAARTGDDPSVRIPAPYPPLCTRQVLVMQRLLGVPLGAAGARPAGDGGPPGADFRALAGQLLETVLHQVLVDGVFHADPHPGNVLLLEDGRLGLLDFGSVGRVDAGLRSGLQRLLLAVDRGDPVALTDALLEVVDRPADLDEAGLQRGLGRFLVRNVGPGLAPDVGMFADLFRLVSNYRLGVPAEIAAVFRSLVTLEGTLTQLAPGFDMVAEARAFAARQFTGRLRPDALRRAANDELLSLVPLLRRIPRRLDRIGAAVEDGRLSMKVRLFADEQDRRTVTGLVHQVLLAGLAATAGIMAVLMLGLPDGPAVTSSVSLYEFLGYGLLVVSAVLALRVLVSIFRPGREGL